MQYIYSDGSVKDGAFEGKLGAKPDYTWLWEELEDIDALSDAEIRGYVKVQGDNIYDMYADECRDAEVETLSFHDFLEETDFEDAVEAVMAARDDAIAEKQLQNIVTVAEAAAEYGIKEDTIRKACQRAGEAGGIRCRQSGSTYLLLRADVMARWVDSDKFLDHKEPPQSID